MIRTAATQETLRYVATGGAVALINNIVLIGGDRLGISYGVLVLLCWVVGGSIGFALHSHVTFRVTPSRASYMHFMAGVAIGIPLSLLLLALCITWLKLPMWFTAPVITLVMFLYNYLNARIAILWRWWRPRARAPIEETQV